MDMTDPKYVTGLKSDIHAVFDSPQGKEVMRYMESIAGWTPTVFDSIETNEIIARDANRRLIGTLKTIMNLNVDQIIGLSSKE